MSNIPIGDPVGPYPSYTYGQYFRPPHPQPQACTPAQVCTTVNPQKEISELKKRIEELEIQVEYLRSFLVI